jgi:hypothetical protein
MNGLHPSGAHGTVKRRSPRSGAGGVVSHAALPSRKSSTAAVRPHRTQAWRQAAAALLLAGAIAGVPSARAEPAPRQQDGRADTAPVPSDIIVNGKRATVCSVPHGRAQGIDYACLNGQLTAAARDGQPVPPVADQTSSQADVPSRVGTFSYSATRQRMGSNFGRSAQPDRPPAPNYANAITAGRPK